MHLTDYGWDKTFESAWRDVNVAGTIPARVIADFGTSLKIATPEVITAELSGKLAHYSGRALVPKVGDWVAARRLDNSPAVIEAVLPRRSEIARKVAGQRTLKQIVAANVDIAFVLLALDGDFSVERLKRFLYQLSIDSVKPVIVLNKADTTADLESFTKQLSSLNLPIIVSVAVSGIGVDDILFHIKPAQTAILLGSSGVGKSTLTNKLLGRNEQATQAVRQRDATGKHTTVHRELFVLPGGGLLIDTPGIRELQLWGTEADLDQNYDDIALLAGSCKFRSCQHTTEPGCNIRKALADGSLPAGHYQSYLKMRAELVSLKAKHSVRAERDNSRSRKLLAKQARDISRDNREQMS